MVKFYSTHYTYDHSFPTVTLAYFLRYPNPYSRHVSSTDTIARTFDPVTQRLTTVRLHLKRSRVPPALSKIMSMGHDSHQPLVDGRTQSHILETSVVDVQQGWMATESRNLDWRNALSVVERHRFTRGDTTITGDMWEQQESQQQRTEVDVSVQLTCRIGETRRKRRARRAEEEEEGAGAELRPSSWMSSLSPLGATRALVEAWSLKRTERSQPKAQKGMGVVLQRLRSGGFEAVREGIRKDREVGI